MDLHFAWQLDLCRPAQRFFENRSLSRKLARVVGVLIVTATAALEIGARWFDSISRRLDHPIQTRARKSGLLLGEPSFDHFSLKHKGNKDAFPGTLSIGCKAGQAFAAVDELFDFKLHGVAF